ncbi:MAG: flagellar hook protein FlgE [Alphaproteobacteria bacterium]|nr:flagellar hook protein FlgE [Alphaproteobacteria bacterium]
MSLFNALTVAVGGLDAQSRSIGHISDNISNSSTIGYKRIDTAFSSLVTQSTASSSDPAGVRATPAYQNNVQGNIAQTQSPLDLAIAGNGFFNVQQPAINAAGVVTFAGDSLYTRRGDFTLDKDGYMTNGAGYVLKAHPISTGTGLVDTSQLLPVQISSAQDNPVATTTISYQANLPASATTTSDFSSSDIQIYDSLGTKHSVTFDWQKLAGANQWRLSITPAGGTATNAIANGDGTTTAAGTSIGTQTLDFTFRGTPPSGTVLSITNTTGSSATSDFFTINSPTTADNPATVTFPATFGTAGSQNITLNFGKYQNAAGMTQFDATNLNVNTIEQNGVAQGSFKDLSIDANGFLSLNYDNGRSRTLYQIPISTFNSPNNLSRKDGGVFSRTIESGTAKTSLPNNNGSGKIVSGSLEGSNVDIAEEFTKMIQAQRVYSANAKTITTSNSMLEEVINVIR